MGILSSGDDGERFREEDLPGVRRRFGSGPDDSPSQFHLPRPTLYQCKGRLRPTTHIRASPTHRSNMTTSQGFVSAVLHRVHAWLTTLILYLLALGPMPRHIGFVMDGNRRYARTKGMKVTQGHTDGFQSLRRVSGSCSYLLSLSAFHPLPRTGV